MEKALQFGLIAAHLNPSDCEEWVKLADMSLEQDNVKQAIICYTKGLYTYLQLPFKGVESLLLTKAVENQWNSNVVNYYYSNCIITVNVIYSLFLTCDQSWIFSIITPVFSVTWSFRNQCNMIICSGNFSYYCWKQLCCSYFFGNRRYIFKRTEIIWKFCWSM